MDAVALGELLIDFSCRETNDDGYPVMDGHPGGAPANWLSPIQKFGKQTAFIGKVGDDSLGRQLKQTLDNNGISTEGLIVDKNVFTTLAFVTFNKQNDREFSFARKPGADTCLSKDEVNYSLIDSAKVFHYGSLSMTNEPSREATITAVNYARKNGKIISYDPNLRKPLWNDLEEAKKQILWGLNHCDVLKISDEEVEFVFDTTDYEKVAEKLINEFGVKLVYITLGKDGCLYKNRNASSRVPGLTGAKVIDTTGAGDIFGGSAMYALLDNGKQPEDLDKNELDNIVKFACTTAGLSTEKKGGISSVPAKEDVLRRNDKKSDTVV